MPGTDPSTWSDKFRANVQDIRMMSSNARALVEIDLQDLNKLFANMAKLGVAMQEDLIHYTVEVYGRIAARTPVRTGRAKLSWHWLPPNSDGDSYIYTVPKSKYGPGETFDGSLTGVKTDAWSTIIGTNVEYMIMLEAGHSRQAPNGMVAITLVETQDALRAMIEKRVAELGN